MRLSGYTNTGSLQQAKRNQHLHAVVVVIIIVVIIIISTDESSVRL
jgi:hypothetical protein